MSQKLTFLNHSANALPRWWAVPHVLILQIALDLRQNDFEERESAAKAFFGQQIALTSHFQLLVRAQLVDDRHDLQRRVFLLQFLHLRLQFLLLFEKRTRNDVLKRSRRQEVTHFLLLNWMGWIELIE